MKTRSLHLLAQFAFAAVLTAPASFAGTSSLLDVIEGHRYQEAINWVTQYNQGNKEASISGLQSKRLIKIFKSKKDKGALSKITTSEATLDLNATDSQGNTALIQSVLHEKSELLKALLLAKADPNLKNQFNKTALMLAIETQKPLMAQILLSHELIDANILDSQGDSPLTRAISLGYTDVAKRLIQMKASVNVRNNEERTPVLLAAQKGDLTTLQLLVENGADLGVQTKLGATALHFAADQGSDDLVKYLLKNGLDINSQDQKGRTPLMYAAQRVNQSTLELLLKSENIQVELEDQEGNTALSLLCKGKKSFNKIDNISKVMDPLLTAGAKIEHLNRQKQSPLLLAAKSGNLIAVNVLLAFGANAEISDEKGNKISDLVKLTSDKAKDLNKQVELARSLNDFSEVKSQLNRYLKLVTPEQYLGLSESAKKELLELKYLKSVVRNLAERMYLAEQEAGLSKLQQVHRKCIVCDEAKKLTEEDAKGPAECSCFMCHDCTPDYLDLLLHRDGGELSVCPGCKGVVRVKYLARHKISEQIQRRFLIRQVNHGNLRAPGWKSCKTEDCAGGRVLIPGEKAFYSCPLCDWSACLNCGVDHLDDNCAAAGEQEKEMKAKLEKMIALGKLPAPRIEENNPNQERFYHGRYRPCYYCGIMTEKNKGCNSIKCTQCQKQWNWNLGNSMAHDGDHAPQKYEPLFPAHF